jgi:hypothetical protein
VLTKMEVFSPQPDAPVLPLGGFMPSQDPIHVRDIDGLGPVNANIASTPLATGRGEQYQGSTTGKRNIVLALGLNPDWVDQTISTLRQMLYRYFMPQSWVKLRFTSDHLPVCEIEGYVESFEPNMFSKDPEMSISIICPKPDFIQADATIIYGKVDDGTIESVFDYVGTIETGYEFRVAASLENPSYTGDLTLVTTAFGEDQLVVVEDILIDVTQFFRFCSVVNAKRVSTVAVADGIFTNRLDKMTPESVWPVLKPGENVITVAGAENDQDWTLVYFNRFGGL